MTKAFCSLLFLLIGVLVGCENSGMNDQTEKVELTVSAAASLTDALGEIRKSFEEENKNIKLIYNFGSSGTLQQQILQGAPVDLFFSASPDKFNQLTEKGHINEQSSIDLVTNEIVLIAPDDKKNEVNSFGDLRGSAKKISIGIPESVPAGKYAKEMLETIGMWNEIEDKIVYAKDVRQVLTYVETGNVDAGIVYKTDAILSKKVNIIASAKEGAHTPIIYPLGIVSDTTYPKEAKIFYQYMQSQEALRILEKYGFSGL
jgi:molybdate transport system substrate-binding protein